LHHGVKDVRETLVSRERRGAKRRDASRSERLAHMCPGELLTRRKTGVKAWCKSLKRV
jgi:hypothetical protein